MLSSYGNKRCVYSALHWRCQLSRLHKWKKNEPIIPPAQKLHQTVQYLWMYSIFEIFQCEMASSLKIRGTTIDESSTYNDLLASSLVLIGFCKDVNPNPDWEYAQHSMDECLMPENVLISLFFITTVCYRDKPIGTTCKSWSTEPVSSISAPKLLDSFGLIFIKNYFTNSIF